jgi:hypothetical protein
VRRATGRLDVWTLAPREREAIDWIAAHPGATVAALRVGRKREWQYVAKLDQSYVLRQGEPPRRFGPRASRTRAATDNSTR